MRIVFILLIVTAVSATKDDLCDAFCSPGYCCRGASGNFCCDEPCCPNDLSAFDGVCEGDMTKWDNYQLMICTRISQQCCSNVGRVCGSFSAKILPACYLGGTALAHPIKSKNVT